MFHLAHEAASQQVGKVARSSMLNFHVTVKPANVSKCYLTLITMCSTINIVTICSIFMWLSSLQMLQSIASHWWQCFHVAFKPANVSKYWITLMTMFSCGFQACKNINLHEWQCVHVLSNLQMWRNANLQWWQCFHVSVKPENISNLKITWMTILMLHNQYCPKLLHFHVALKICKNYKPFLYTVLLQLIGDISSDSL